MKYKLTQLNRWFRSPLQALFGLTILIVALWGISLLLHGLGFPYLTPVTGLVVLFAPGLCLALLLEQLTEEEADPLLFLTWVILFTMVITPTAVYGINQVFLSELPVRDVITPFIIWWAITFGLTALVYLIKRQPSIVQRFSFDRTTKRELGYIVGGFGLIMLINFMLYPLLPEGDGYALLVNWDSIRLDPKLILNETRIPFLVFINLFSQLFKIEPYWALKVFLPLSHIAVVLSCYVFVRQFVTNSHYRVLLSLSPFFFPIVLQEILIGRPQSVVTIAFLPTLVILSEVLANKQNIRRLYWLFALLVVSILGVKIHTLFALLAIVSFVSILLFVRQIAAKRPLDSFIIALGLVILVLPTVMNARILPDIWHLIKLFARTFHESHFEWWFIDRYHNVDASEVGWPGISALFYYGYNFGLVFPLLFLLYIARKKIRTFRDLLKEKYTGFILLFLFYFFIAEIAPRFQVAYLPDRAWLFLALIFALVLPLMVRVLSKSFGPRFVSFFALICFLSIASGTALTYLKQGWITSSEVAAASFIKTQTPDDALFLTQGGTRMMVRYYTKRAAVRPEDKAIFLTGDKASLENYLKTEEQAFQEGIDNAPKEKANLSLELNTAAALLLKPTLTRDELSAILDRVVLLVQQRGRYVVDEETLKGSYPTIGKSIYLIYNQNKFNSLYGSRSWWRSSNFYGANVERLNATYPIVYNKDDVTIWEARKF